MADCRVVEDTIKWVYTHAMLFVVAVVVVVVVASALRRRRCCCCCCCWWWLWQRKVPSAATAVSRRRPVMCRTLRHPVLPKNKKKRRRGWNELGRNLEAGLEAVRQLNRITITTTTGRGGDRGVDGDDTRLQTEGSVNSAHYHRRSNIAGGGRDGGGEEAEQRPAAMGGATPLAPAAGTGDGGVLERMRR